MSAMSVTPREHLTAIEARHPDATQPTPEDAPLIARVDKLLAAITEAGRAREASEYADAFGRVFTELDAWDTQLASQRFLLGGASPSRADFWLYTILIRFDAVFYGLYKCNLRRIDDYAHLSGYVRDVHHVGALEDTVDFDAIKKHYYQADEGINPRLLVPMGAPDMQSPHDRMRFDAGGLAQVGTQEDQHKRRGKGEWVRKTSGHRDWITRDGSSGFKAEPGRYHLYVANNCPWCHRVTLARKLKKLDDIVSMDVLFYRRNPERGWQFRPEEPGCTVESLYGYRFLKEIYERVGSNETSAPVLFDKKTETIVNNESAEIIRMFNDAFSDHTDAHDLYPADLAAQIDQLNGWIYTDINNGAYKAGFARTQEAYEAAYERLFAALERLDRILDTRRFVAGDRLTLADVRLFPTIFRFDHIYYTRFRLNKRMVREYGNLFRWARDVYHQKGVAEASNLDHARMGYFGRTGNNLVPLGPELDFEPVPTDAELASLD